jgi:DNA-directed RNA polymerase beta subunit
MLMQISSLSTIVLKKKEWLVLILMRKHTINLEKTNQGTSINLKPIVRKGDRVVLGQVLSEGYATQNGEWL